MKLLVEILDHIFGFLALSQRGTLIACSKIPTLSSIVEKHLYHHVIVQINGSPDPDYAFEPDHLSKLVSGMPRILNQVRILQIQLENFKLNYHWQLEPQRLADALDEFAKTLLMFPVLECIILTSSNQSGWYWSPGFQAAFEDRLNLPTLKELHLVGSKDFPFSLLDNCKNIKNLSLSGSFRAEGQFCDSTLPQLKSLTLSSDSISSSLLAWLKLHSNELWSLKCTLSSVEAMSQLLGVCSGTLDIDVAHSQYYSMYKFRTGQTMQPLPELLPFPPNLLEHLIIRTALDQPQNHDPCLHPKFYASWLPAAVKTIALFSSIRHLVLDINIEFFTFPDLDNFDFSPLAVLGASPSIQRIDLYVHTGRLPSALTHAYLLSSVENYKGVVGLIKEGKLVIHSEKTAPDYML